MDSYYDEIYLLDNGLINLVSSGKYNITYSPSYKEEYAWDGQTMTKEKYEAKLNRYFDKSKSKSTFETESFYDCYNISKAILTY